MGERAAMLRRALQLVADALPGAAVRTAGPVESAPWGYESDRPYLNLGVMIDLPDGAVEPLQLLDITQEAERTISAAPHRNADGTYRDRPVDIDIIDIDGMRLHTPRLTLPHPRAALRAFVMEPLRELDPAAAARLALRPDAIIGPAGR